MSEQKWYLNKYIQETLIPATTVPKVTKANRMIKSYKYTNLIECSESISDPYWSKIIMEMARGKFIIPGFYYDGKFLTYLKADALELNGSSEAKARQIVAYYQRHGHWSQEDIEHMKERDKSKNEEKIDYQPINSWSELIKIKSKKQDSIINYVKKNYSHLSKSIQNLLITKIQIFIVLKMIDDDYIMVRDGVITNIIGIDANEDGVFLTEELKNPVNPKTSKPRDSKMKSGHYDSWVKFIYFYNMDIVKSPSSTALESNDEVCESSDM